MATAADSGTWRLGELAVRRLGFGALRLTGPWSGPGGGPGVRVDRARSIEVLRRAVELGVDHIDTAAFYFSATASANELINTALAPYPDDLVIATKVGPGRDYAGDWLADVPPDRLRAQVEENLRQLGREHVDLVNFRLTGQRSVAEYVGALAELRTAGMIREIGVSGVTRAQLDEARAVAPIVCVQNRYGLGARTPDEDALVAYCGELGIAYVPYFAIAGPGGRQGVDPGADHPAITHVAAAHGATAAQVRLAWTLHRGGHVLAIPGTGDPAHLVENVAAGALRLTPAELSTLDNGTG